MKCTFHVENNQYNKCWLKTTTNQYIFLEPKIYRFFEGDEVEFDEKTKQLNLIRCNMPKLFPGTILFTDKIYGKHSNNKYYFKFIPYDKNYPALLVHCKPDIVFNKKKRNKYAIIEYSNWPNTSKHPYGNIRQGLGYVDVPIHTYEYLLVCHSVHTHIKTLNDKTKHALKRKPISEWGEYINTKYNIVDRRKDNTKIFSIDPRGTKDIDDACSITRINDTELRMSIYIAHVPLWLDVLGLWEYMSDNVSTVYLPHKNMNMLPNILSEEICSLKEGQYKFAFTLDIYLNNEYKITRKEFNNTWIYIESNDTYEHVTGPEYNYLFDIVNVLNHSYPYVSNGIHDSHDVIQYMMTLMNCELAKVCALNGFGIFRTMHVQEMNVIQDIPKELRSFMRIWNSPGGTYAMYTKENNRLHHDCIGSSVYMHITSPIRRLVNVINMVLYLNNTKFLKGNRIKDFINKCYTKQYVEYINYNAKQIRRLQNECNMIHKTIIDTDFLKNEYEGYVIEIVKNEMHIQYSLYFPGLKMTHQIKYETALDCDLILFKKYKWKIAYINDDYKIKKRWIFTQV